MTGRAEQRLVAVMPGQPRRVHRPRLRRRRTGVPWRSGRYEVCRYGSGSTDQEVGEGPWHANPRGPSGPAQAVRHSCLPSWAGETTLRRVPARCHGVRQRIAHRRIETRGSSAQCRRGEHRLPGPREESRGRDLWSSGPNRFESWALALMLVTVERGRQARKVFLCGPSIHLPSGPADLLSRGSSNPLGPTVVRLGAENQGRSGAAARP